jgi:hypothetical protein
MRHTSATLPKVVDPPPQMPGDPVPGESHEHPTPSPTEVPGEPNPPHPSPDPKELTREPRAPSPREPKTSNPKRRIAQRRRVSTHRHGARAQRSVG